MFSTWEFEYSLFVVFFSILNKNCKNVYFIYLELENTFIYKTFILFLIYFISILF